MNEPLNYKDWRSADIAGKYLTGVRGAIPLARVQLEVMVKICREFLSGIDNFLDLGCGDGVLGRYIQEQYPDAYGVFLDYSEPMIEVLESKINSKSRILNRDYSHDVWLKDLESEKPFDLIVSGFSIHHLENRDKKILYQRIYGLLKPGGLFLNLEHVASATPGIEKIHDEIFIDSLVEFHKKTRTREEVAAEYYNRDDKALNILLPVEDQCRWLREIGFLHVDCFFKIFELALFGGVKPG